MTTVNFVLNNYKSPIRITDYTLSLISTIPTIISTLPTSGDISSNCSAVKNQGIDGACVSFAVIAAMEFLSKKNGINNIYSEKYNYYYTRLLGGSLYTQDSGAFIGNALRSLSTNSDPNTNANKGTSLLSVFPNTNSYNVIPPTPATVYKIATYALLDTTTGITSFKTSINSGIPIIIGFNCYSDILNITTGIIPIPGSNNTSVIGGHAVLIVGYDDSTQLFKFKNSWGSSWGVGGYGYLPYSYYPQDISDMYTILSETDAYNNVNTNISTTNLVIVNPSTITTILQGQITSLFTDINTNIVIVNDKTKYINYFTNYLIAFPVNANNAKIITFINNIKNAFTFLNNS